MPKKPDPRLAHYFADSIGIATLRAVATALALPVPTDREAKALRYSWACANRDDQPYQASHWANITPAEMAYNLGACAGNERIMTAFGGGLVGKRGPWPTNTQSDAHDAALRAYHARCNT